ncbi:hypothetical protein LK07_21255 [Streptomyces pluripotens]|uniref:Uncharacterized protein n=1 Tax=Streptomyces pluripotens TaxID=1355015 RepID=A0A221P1L6_9ACTN|nr:MULTISPECIES: hypothetical protein [Streptomyces]ARP71873.1 hypothetical protein LK06_020100 [Streptomyces pluripotens]ASN26121.1 hypothetical protein LK07_21255 [Streptomyces pluripotens]KIE26288.1 hypothetical protein LK08_13810 [Streptomyces sp. MUSC 125]MCH0556353.1 hypothetical protein [Streptomyces sp. MUM 16J]
MSQSAPPPQPPQSAPVGGNPYAKQAPPPAPGAPYPPQPGASATPPAPPAPVRNNLPLGLLSAFAAAVVAAALYGAVIGLTEHEIGWAAIGVGFVIGATAGKTGGRNPVLPIASVVLALASVYLGQLVGTALIVAKKTPWSFTEAFFGHFGLLQTAWKDAADPLTFLFFAIAAFAAFSGAKKAAA